MTHKHLILIGMMTSGKSTIGKSLSLKMQRPHHDLDDFISTNLNKSIDEIIQLHTWENFRILEEQSLNSLLHKLTTPSIISLGGGTYTHKNNLGHAALHHTIYLQCEIDTLMARLTPKELKQRPLLSTLKADQLKLTLQKILIDRSSLYQQCEIHLQCDHLDSNSIVDEILKRL